MLLLWDWETKSLPHKTHSYGFCFCFPVLRDMAMASLQLTTTPWGGNQRRLNFLPSFEGMRPCTSRVSASFGAFGCGIENFGCFRGLSVRDVEACRPKVGVVRAAWTRRSRGEAAKKPNRKSWSQRTDMYMKPFLLNVFFSKRYIHAKVVHRGTSKVISVASTNAKDLRNTLPSLIDNEACRTVGRLIAERSKEADVFAIAYDVGKDERIEGRLGIIFDTIKENGIIFE